MTCALCGDSGAVELADGRAVNCPDCLLVDLQVLREELIAEKRARPRMDLTDAVREMAEHAFRSGLAHGAPIDLAHVVQQQTDDKLFQQWWYEEDGEADCIAQAVFHEPRIIRLLQRLNGDLSL